MRTHPHPLTPSPFLKEWRRGRFIASKKDDLCSSLLPLSTPLRVERGLGGEVLFLLLLALTSIGFLGCGQKTPEKIPRQASQEKKVALYQCPMHHQIIREHPGTSPICGMTLVPIHD